MQTEDASRGETTNCTTRKGPTSSVCLQPADATPRSPTPTDNPGPIMRKHSFLALAAFAALAAAQGGASATTLPYKGLDKLVAEADGIVIGTVRQVQSVQDSAKDIHTFVTFDHVKM